MRAIDLTGKRFGKLVVVEANGRSREEIAWLAQCDCGRRVTVGGYKLRSGWTKSCGCIKSATVRPERHGLTPRGARTPGYSSWAEMRSRCTNDKSRHFKNYGGRGIYVCARWSASFADFLSDMGPPFVGASIDRIDNDKGYTCGKCDDCVARSAPANCRWATRAQQARNNRRTRNITLNGETRCLADWKSLLGFSGSMFFTLSRKLGDAGAIAFLSALSEAQRAARAA